LECGFDQAVQGGVEMNKHVVHLLSGGLDSVVLLHDLIQQGCNVHCVLFDYGQNHGSRELPLAKKQCEIAGVSFTEIKIPQIRGSSLTSGSGSKVVPNRNAILLSFAVSLAVNAKAESVTIACNADDAADFPDCRPRFIDRMDQAAFSAGTGVEVCAPYLYQRKAEIVEIGRKLGVNFDLTWSCYIGGEVPCRECDACKKRAEALA
jgi:7-cyano-7-deazaguanine synthase